MRRRRVLVIRYPLPVLRVTDEDTTTNFVMFLNSFIFFSMCYCFHTLISLMSNVKSGRIKKRSIIVGTSKKKKVMKV